MQLAGAKYWEAWDSPLLLTQGPRPTGYEGRPPMELRLAAGDVLYLPANWIHRATTTPSGPHTANGTQRGASSLHLTVTPKTDDYSRQKLLDALLSLLPQYVASHISPSHSPTSQHELAAKNV